VEIEAAADRIEQLERENSMLRDSAAEHIQLLENSNIALYTELCNLRSRGDYIHELEDLKVLSQKDKERMDLLENADNDTMQWIFTEACNDRRITRDAIDNYRTRKTR
jgi:hypothetical protein